jgi:hypothetical protein
MSCLSWNYRRLGSAAIVKEIRELVKKVALPCFVSLKLRSTEHRLKVLKVP